MCLSQYPLVLLSLVSKTRYLVTEGAPIYLVFKKWSNMWSWAPEGTGHQNGLTAVPWFRACKKGEL
jgi:hypothetical protein